MVTAVSEFIEPVGSMIPKHNYIIHQPPHNARLA